MTTLIWVLLGAGLCMMELFLPTAFVAMMMGISALIVGLLSYLGMANLWLQGSVWLALSALLIFSSRRLLGRGRAQLKLKGATIAEALTEIPAGQPGRVLYEGNSWRALCDDESIFIAPGEPVYVVRREGTTLIVMPKSLLHS